MDIIHYLLQLIQYLYQQNCWLINFICRYISLKQWVFDDSHCSSSNDFGYEVSQWSLPLLVAEIKKQGIAAQISEKSVSRFLKMR